VGGGRGEEGWKERGEEGERGGGRRGRGCGMLMQVYIVICYIYGCNKLILGPAIRNAYTYSTYCMHVLQ
jgi:hypothetical protein